jgi:uncharacterized protein YbjT (DUF2867 family)
VIVLAGATGNLGGRIARELLQQGAGVVALVRHGGASGKVEALRTLGATIAEVAFSNLAAVARHAVSTQYVQRPGNARPPR